MNSPLLLLFFGGLLLTIGDLHPMFDGTAAERIAMKHFPDYDGLVPEGAYPAGWLK